jgi:uncharacterized C2H2 Zn-finger protein
MSFRHYLELVKVAEKLLKCPYCECFFASEADLKSHILAWHLTEHYVVQKNLKGWNPLKRDQYGC